MNVIGGITIAFKFYGFWVLPMLLFGCNAWSPMTRVTIKKLNKPTKSSKCTLNAEDTICPPPHVYWLLWKLLLVHHIIMLQSADLLINCIMLRQSTLFLIFMSQSAYKNNKNNIFYFPHKKTKKNAIFLPKMTTNHTMPSP